MSESTVENLVKDQSQVNPAILNQAVKTANEAVDKLKYEMAVFALPVVEGKKKMADFSTEEQNQWQKMVEQQKFNREVLDGLIGQVKSSAVDVDGVSQEAFDKALRDQAMKNLREQKEIPEANDLNINEHIANFFDAVGAVKHSRVGKSQDNPIDLFKPHGALGHQNKKTVAEFVFQYGEEAVASQLLQTKSEDEYKTGNMKNLKSIYTGAIGNPVQDGANGYGGYVCGLEIDPMICLRKSPIMEDCVSHVPATGSRILFTRQAFESNQMDFVPETIYATAAPLPVQPARIGRKPEVHMGFEDVSVRIGKLAGYQRISEETFEDCPTIANAVVTTMERFYNEKKMEAILVGDGVFPNVLGAYNQPGILASIFRDAGSRGLNTDTRRDFLRRIRTDLQINGCSPEQLQAIIHPYDLEEMDLEKDAEGRYLLEVQGDCVTSRVWCVNLCANAFAPENQMLVGDLARSVRVHERQSMRVWIGYVGESAIENALYIIVEGRFGVSICDTFCVLKATGM